MKDYLKHFQGTGRYFALVAVLILLIAGGGPGEPDPPVWRTIYATPSNFVATVAFQTNNQAIIAADNHAFSNDIYLEDVVSNPYWQGHHMYLEYGVTTRNCSDHDHQSNIIEVNGVEAVRFVHDIQWSGSIWLQYVSQCEEDFDSDPTGIGVYYKGTQWYPAFGYPTSPSRDIIIRQATLTNCQFPWNVTSGATEYGCGTGDAT